MEDNKELSAGTADVGGIAGFRSGALVIVALSSPREKFWGVLLSLTAPGIVLRAISLESFDDFVAQVRAHESPLAGTMFFPMQRVERIELDESAGDFESLSQRFETKTGKSAQRALMGTIDASRPEERP